jgi:hypothetical protein
MASLNAFRLLVATSVFKWLATTQSGHHHYIFVNGDIKADVCIGVPEGMDLDPRRYVLKLRRSFIWPQASAPGIVENMSNFLPSTCGFHRCEAYENCFVILLPFVADILLTGIDQGIETFVEE